MTILEFLHFKQIGVFTPLLQILLICTLLILALVTQYKEYKKTGKTYGRYPWRISTFLSSIYEEIIFRGIILIGLLILFPTPISIVISSILFGLWHLKNYRWQTRQYTFKQVLYAGIIFGPIASIITLWTETIWMAVIFHYAHNLLTEVFRKKSL